MTPAPACKSLIPRLLKAVALLLIAGLCFALVLTDRTPLTAARPAPSAEQVVVGREAVRQLGSDVALAPGTHSLRFGPEELDGLSALISHSIRPNRLDLSVVKGVLHVQASRELPFGRWLNVSAQTSGSAKGFPVVRMQVGSLKLSPFFSRLLLGTLRSGSRIAGSDIPELDDLIRKLVVEDSAVSATINLPEEMDLLARLTGNQGNLDPALVVEAYCALAEAQRSDPNSDLAAQVRRAFPGGRAAMATPEDNGAAFVALAMAIVGKKEVGELAGVETHQMASCQMPVADITLHGREDLAKHWALSAALTASRGTQLAEAMGEWKELADSLAGHPKLQPGDPTGFSFVDIAANRSGFRVSEVAVDRTRASKMALRLSTATQDQILPRSMLALQEGVTADFANKFGGLDDPRFAKVLKDIDVTLKREGLLRP